MTEEGVRSLRTLLPRPESLLHSWIAGYTALALAALVSTAAVSPAWARHWPVLWRFRHAFKTHHLAMIAACFVLIAWACVYLLSRIVVAKPSVSNASDPAMFMRRSLPGFVQQNRDAATLLHFRSHVEGAVEGEYPDFLSKAVAIRRWVRRQQSQDASVWLKRARVNHENPLRLLEEQRRGVPGACRRFAYVLTGALLSAGFDARIVSFTNSLFRVGVTRHDVVEVWIEDLGKWVLLDPTFDTLVLIDGRPASAIELEEAIAGRELDRITFDRGGAALEPHPTAESYAKCCRHLFVAMSNAIFDGYAVRVFGPKRIRFLHYSPEASYPVFRKFVLLGIGGSGIFLSVVFWAWTFASLFEQ